MTDEFSEGMEGDCGGVRWRIRGGSKSADDLVIELYCPNWTPVKMALGGAITRFLYENEDRLYPPPRYKGGRKYLEYLRDCIAGEWAWATAKLEQERIAAEDRRRAVA